MNKTSVYHHELSEDATKLTIHTRNVIPVTISTFRIYLTEQDNSVSVVSIIYSVMSSLFSIVLCCICIMGCVRCIQREQETNYDVEEVNPEWDPQQIRYFHMRVLERRMARLREQNEQD